MKTLNITVKDADYGAAERAAKDAVKWEDGKSTMMAWYDKPRNMEGPREACAKEGWKCARVYADNHGADVGVIVNDGEYEFYFSKVPASFTELDRDESLEAHKEAEQGEFDNVQGG